MNTAIKSEVIKELCILTGIGKSKTTPFRSSENGCCERMNRSLISMLSTLEPDKRANWKTHIDSLVHSYNCTRNETTGYTPYQLLFGRRPRVALDVVLGLVTEHESREYDEYIGHLQSLNYGNIMHSGMFLGLYTYFDNQKAY